MKRLFFLLSFVCVLVTSCNFNKLFLYPTIVKHDEQMTLLVNPFTHDSIYVSYRGECAEPCYFTSKKDSMQLPFTIESFYFTNAKGTRLNGWLLKHRETTAPAITVLHFHGNSGSLAYTTPPVAGLVNKNVQVFVFDYSGFGLSDGKATIRNARRDGLAALEYVKNRPETKGTKLIVYGQSFGGQVAAEVALEKKDLVDALVLEGTFTTFSEIGGHFAYHVHAPAFLARAMIANPYSAKKSVRKFHKPVLVIHSINDRIVPFFLGKKVFENANQPKELFVTDSCHVCGPEIYSDSIYAKMKRMLNQ